MPQIIKVLIFLTGAAIVGVADKSFDMWPQIDHVKKWEIFGLKLDEKIIKSGFEVLKSFFPRQN